MIFLYALTINCVTTGVRELNRINLIWLDLIIQSVKCDEMSSGLVRMGTTQEDLSRHN